MFCTYTEASLATGVAVQEIARLAREGVVRTLKTNKGKTLVEMESLARALDEELEELCDSEDDSEEQEGETPQLAQDDFEKNGDFLAPDEESEEESDECDCSTDCDCDCDS